MSINENDMDQRIPATDAGYSLKEKYTFKKRFVVFFVTTLLQKWILYKEHCYDFERKHRTLAKQLGLGWCTVRKPLSEAVGKKVMIHVMR